jgi:hypothetical protein
VDGEPLLERVGAQRPVHDPVEGEVAERQAGDLAALVRGGERQE